MELAPCSEDVRRTLVLALDRLQVDTKQAEYLVKLFPNVLLDVSRLLVEQATHYARETTNIDPAEAIRQQLKPFFTFGFLLGKSPQITSLMYSYFEQSSFQPLPEEFFKLNESPDSANPVTYAYPAFDDDLVRDILKTYFKYLVFNPKLFSSVWNWAELGRIVALHPNHDLRYLAICNLSIITCPDRGQHWSLLRDLNVDNEMLIGIQIRYCEIYDDVFTPLIESNQEKRELYLDHMGRSETGYSFDSQTLAKVTNILLLKHDISSTSAKSETMVTIDKITKSFVPVITLTDAISRTAYAASINKPCLVRGPPGCGKTSLIDYIAAQTNRASPPVYLKVQVGDHIDSKLLLGSYVCTEIPGQFEWQPGPLTQAMAYGSWIVFEDIDSAPDEMAQVIHSVIENGNLSCVSSCPIKIDSPHPDFRIFFTQRTHGSSKALKLGFGFVERLCDIVEVPELSMEDLKQIISTRYSFTAANNDLVVKIIEIFQEAEQLANETTLSGVTRLISLRDLFKFCDRVNLRKISQSSEGQYNQKDLDAILADAFDCFVAFLPERFRVEIAQKLGNVMNKPPQHVLEYLMSRRPEIRVESNSFAVGRVKMDISGSSSNAVRLSLDLAKTRQFAQMIESVSLCIKHNEPVLLVGETGVGKTTIVQHLSHLMKTELVVLNLSQQSDSSDLLGGYRPVDMREIMKPINDRFTDLFKQTFDAHENREFMKRAEGLYLKSKNCSEWLTYVKLVYAMSAKGIERTSQPDRREKWVNLLERSRRLSKRMSNDSSSPMALSFVEGSLLRAVRKGCWILLDEINLAEPDILQCLLLILDSLKDSYVYMQGADQENEGMIKIHPNFRIFACMNPSTDVGKRDLPVSTRARFTEFFMDDVTERHELRLIVESYVKTCLNTVQIERIVDFYQKIRSKSGSLSDISGNSPVYSLRTLCRALTICGRNVCRNMERSLFESLAITFFQQLNQSSVSKVLGLIESTIFKQTSFKNLTEDPIKMPQDSHQYIQVQGFWIQTSSQPKIEDENYIITDSVRENLKRISRIISLGERRLPILIQGNTSVGKTSLIKYLAKMTGNYCHRINNHEHTDLQDYVGRYVLRESGELQFQEGLLVTAMKKGHWVILDELNLAPCELLEALNRVLDDNRELFIPDTREVVHAHSKFMLFATQNPPEEYAGRKILSRAFRNRFIELNFDEIPPHELEEILHKRCRMPPQYAKKIVSVMRELQMFRRESGCFSGKSSFMTMRDLFRWGERYSVFKDSVADGQMLDWEEFLATEGLILLEGRVRTQNEAETVKSIIEKVFKRVLDRSTIYNYCLPFQLNLDPKFRHLDFDDNYKKIFVQLSQALKYNEPVLLCGQTGSGKTTACQLYAKILQQELVTYNCHLNSECSDFVGNVRPSRSDNRSFPWVDGPLVQAMRRGAIFLMDEISLADDAVLERINSVLEPERSITLTEKDGEQVIAKRPFRFVATMNPGGDYGKKELSPALRNRFTEIYCHNPMAVSQIMNIVEKALNPGLLQPKILPNLIEVIKRFLKDYYNGQNIISLRDVISFIQFLNNTTQKNRIIPLSVQQALIDGAQLVFFDQFGTCGFRASRPDATDEFKVRIQSKLERLVQSKFGQRPVLTAELQCNPISDTKYVKIDSYGIRRGPETSSEDKDFVFESSTVRSNQLKIVRALQLDRPILLEGDPGAGKTSIVAALAKKLGHKLIRINLSEQTDISDLFGSDLPDASNSSEDTPRFCWHDGPLLTAIKTSSWILLDEMNLAPQSVLEGLNACFDHRGEICIPELNKIFTVDRSATRIFACQNPYDQGAARKGLPQSFLNRFTSIYIQSHTSMDLVIILKKLYPMLTEDTINRMIEFNSQLNQCYKVHGYEFNLRDMIYWCDLTTRYVKGDDFKREDLYDPGRFVQFVYIDRLRSAEEKAEVSDLFEKVFNYPIYEPPYRELKLGEFSMIFSRAILRRKKRPSPHLFDLCILKYQMPYLESIAVALESNKMPILVGETGTGKRTMVRILAGLTGNHLAVVAANGDMDTVELLGSFEQKSLQREMVDLVEDAGTYVKSLINSITNRTSDCSWTQLYKHIWSTLYATANRDLKLSKSEMMVAYRFQLSQMDELIARLEPLSIHNNEATRKALRARIKSLTRKLLYQSESTYSSGNFEWIDSVLVKSIKEGKWLMIENANLMNPATLDRLNSLVEPNGCLSMNEKGSDERGIEMLRPHPDFRLILTMNPEYGELSRAMRNRGVEIYIRPRFYFEDFLMLLQKNGFKPAEGKACLAYCIMQTCYDAHLKITGEGAEIDGGLLAYFGLNYLNTMAQQIRRGVKVEEILADLILSFYHRKGFIESKLDSSIISFIHSKFEEYKKTYVVDLNDDRYKWCNFMHDLVSMTGGDAITAMLSRESKLFCDNSDPVANGLLKLNEIVDSLDIVNTCMSVKIFMEMSSQGDFGYRKGFIKETFTAFQKFTDTVNKHVNFLHLDCLPLINSEMPCSDLIPVSEMYVDTRNCPDLQYYLQAIDFKGTIQREDIQNRWLLTLHRITIKMIVELIEERSLETEGHVSLYQLSEKVCAGDLLKEDLVRPQAEIALDIHDFLVGILRVVGDRCFDSSLVPKMLSRFFWIGYFLCKLRRGYNRLELIAICNQIPMLWALTYQKVIVPIIRDCNLADLTYNSRKFSDRIKRVCDFLEIDVTKPGHIEKEYYNKIINLHAAVTKRCEIIGREIDKFFSHLLSRYTKPQSSSSTVCNHDTLTASSLVWTNSNFALHMYKVQEMMLSIGTISDDCENSTKANAIFENAKKIVREKFSEYKNHEDALARDSQHRNKCNHRGSALDQFAPIWQVKFLQIRLSLLSSQSPKDALCLYRERLPQMIHLVNGVIMSPRYYGTLLKFFRGIEEYLRKESLNESIADTSVDDLSLTETHKGIKRQFRDMYATFLVDHLMENIVLDHQVVGWTKMRVTTSDLSSSAPLIPEYSPIISLVGSYCLDIKHLKLNSYQNSNPQLDSMLLYLWRAYSIIKKDPLEDLQDIALAKNLIHVRCMEADSNDTIIGKHNCSGPNASCVCVDAFIILRCPKFSEMINNIKDLADPGDAEIIQKSIKLIYFGYYNMIEFAPIFTMDPSLRSREKLEIYNSELAHIKLDLNQRNTLYYWKTGENLRLVEIKPEEAKSYPFSLRVLVERRHKLEKSIKRLRKDYTNRPKTDDGSQYLKLRKEVQVTINRYTQIVETLIKEIISYTSQKNSVVRTKRLRNLNTKCRMLIKSIETTINHFKSNYILYSDLTTHYLVGLCFMLKGLRRLYSRLEPKLQLLDLGFGHSSVEKFSADIMRVFSFNQFTINNLESVANKRALYKNLGRICPSEKISHIQSLLLRSILLQLNHHILMTPSDIKRCIPIVQDVADRFHKAWLERKKFLEEQRRKQEDLYQYKTSITSLGNEPHFERREFIEVCTKFPIYDHIYQDNITSRAEKLSADEQNLATEAKILNLNKSVDLTMCIDVCRAHYKFMKEASSNLLGQQDRVDMGSSTSKAKSIELNDLIKIEAEILYTIMRHCAPYFDKVFDALSLECHLLQANELIHLFKREKSAHNELGSLKSTIEILDENIFDIYHDADVCEALRLQEFMTKTDKRIVALRNNKVYEGHPALNDITRLTTKISSFLLTDPLMKFVTGAHMLLQCIEDYNQKVPRDHRLTNEVDELINLIKSWREIEVKSWRNSLHRVKKKYIDDSLCDLWFQLYEAFRDPASAVKQKCIQTWDIDEEDYNLAPDDELFYHCFIQIIIEFLEKKTLGDYQIRLDLVFAFAIQTRFASLFEQSKKIKCKSEVKTNGSPDKSGLNSSSKIDYDKLTTYVYNTYCIYQDQYKPLKERLELEEKHFSNLLNEQIRIVNWQGRNAWDIKTNFRISHRKLNSVMNQYLDCLREEKIGGQTEGSLSDKMFELNSRLNDQSISSFLLNRYTNTSNLIDESKKFPICIKYDLKNLKSLSSAIASISRMKNILKDVCRLSSEHYVHILESFEASIEHNEDSIKNFHSYKVQAVTINPNDRKEVRDEKMKTCRQMYHAKKFAMQAVFKDLQELGISYQRGLNIRNLSDTMILSIEPLRGLIQVQSRSTMKTSCELVNDVLISSCNDLFRKMLTMYQFFLVNQQSDRDDIDSDQKNRIHGFTFDIVIDIFMNNRNVAILYKNFMEIQAAATRLNQLQKACEESSGIIVYHFAKVHKVVQVFDELVGRTVSSFYKLDLLMNCCRTYEELLNLNENLDGGNHKTERQVLKDLIGEIDERNSSMTRIQFEHVKANFDSIRCDVSKIGIELRDKLKHTVKNHIYSDDDIEHLRMLFAQFVKTFDRFFVPEESRDQLNMQTGTVMGSMNQLLIEAKQRLGPLLDDLGNKDKTEQPIAVDNHPNAQKLNLRLHKLIKSFKLVSQDMYKFELKSTDTKQILSESEKRKLKPFKHVDSSTIRDLLRPHQIARQIANCFMTINVGSECDIKPLVSASAPIMNIYTQNLANYLNLMLTSLQLKLISANLLIPFFTDLIMKGFGLPCKLEELNDFAKENKSFDQEQKEDNTGFGEGQGDKDASSKIEFESQLDELKRDEGQADQENKEGNSEDNGKQEEPIKASDDGIEMTDDFDAEAQGPEGGQQEDQDNDQTEEEKELQAELDKKFDQVDEDEGHLDQQLWDKDDEEEGLKDNDDEADLREADVDKSVKPEFDDIDFMAKDEKSEQSSEKRPGDSAKESEAKQDHSGEDMDMESSSEAGDKDLGEETVEPDMNELPNDNNDDIDMSDVFEDAEEGDNDPTGDLDAMSDISEYGSELEKLVEPNTTTPKEEESNEIETPSDEMSHEILLDSDKQDNTHQQPGHGGMDPSEVGNNQDDSLPQDKEQSEMANPDNDDEVSPDSKLDALKQKEGIKQDGQQQDPTETKQDVPSAATRSDDEDTSCKRTFAKRNSLEEQDKIKRQRIEAAKRADDNQETCEDKMESSEDVRHLEQDSSNAIEVVDLASDSDDDLLLHDPIAELEPIEMDKSKANQRSTGVGDQSQKIGDDHEEKMSGDDEQKENTHPSSYNTNLGLLKYITHDKHKDKAERTDDDNLMEQIDKELNANKSLSTEHESIEMDKLTKLWSDCTSTTNNLVHELCQQLQIVLQPTKMSKYRGDYKTGKRLNMRKIISYIASHYRKDKIWLRRTKPNKRTYNISLAVDNSSSMSENNCRAMTYQSLALLARSLSLIEAGSLSVVKFGEQVQCIHEFGQPYMDAIGAQWLKELRFNERRTSYSGMLKFSCEAFAKQAQQSPSTRADLRASVHQLLIVISDGRNVTSEEEEVKGYLRQLKSLGVLTLFVIIDDLKQNDGKSIVDVKSCIRYEGSSDQKKAGALRVENYLDVFPFPFYVLLRQIESMPSILGDALRQWFELVSNLR